MVKISIYCKASFLFVSIKTDKVKGEEMMSMRYFLLGLVGFFQSYASEHYAIVEGNSILNSYPQYHSAITHLNKAKSHQNYKKNIIEAFYNYYQFLSQIISDSLCYTDYSYEEFNKSLDNMQKKFTIDFAQCTHKYGVPKDLRKQEIQFKQEILKNSLQEVKKKESMPAQWPVGELLPKKIWYKERIKLIKYCIEMGIAITNRSIIDSYLKEQAIIHTRNSI